ncbi:MAG: ROK family protein [Sinomonas sp.]|nr:ROK family protein [Sinomonas sp.]
MSTRNRTVTNAPNLPQVTEPGFLDRVEEAVGCPTGFDNDANYALLGELHFGAAKASPNAAMLTIGYGLGAGLAIDGRILRGEHGLIGEFGQLPIGPFGSRLENMVTGSGILRRAAEAGIEMDNPSAVFADAPEPALQRIRLQFDEAINVVLAALTVACDPQVIVIGGGIAASLNTSLSRYAEALERNLGVSPRLVKADLGRYSGAAGALVAALHGVYGELGVHEASILTLPNSPTPFTIGPNGKSHQH